MRANGQCCAVLHCFHRQVWLELARLHVEGWPGVAGRGDLTQWWTFKRSEVKWRTMFWLWDKPSIMESPMHATGCSYCSYCWCLLCDLRPKFLFWLVIVELVRSNTWNGVNALTSQNFLNYDSWGLHAVWCSVLLFCFQTFLCRQWAQKPWCRMRDTLPITVDVTLQNLDPQEDPWLDLWQLSKKGRILIMIFNFTDWLEFQEFMS